jgi:hypothetical protein
MVAWLHGFMVAWLDRWFLLVAWLDQWIVGLLVV